MPPVSDMFSFSASKRLALFVLGGIWLMTGTASGDSHSLWKTVKKDSEGLYLTHIPGIFSIHTVRMEPGVAYSGTIRDPGGWVHVTRNHDPGREMVLERLSDDSLRFLIAPSNKHRPVGFSFETSTGCFTLRARQTPTGAIPGIHLNGFGPPVTKLPVIFCGNGPHIRVEWQGPLPKVRPDASNLKKRSRKDAH
ncbi:MAG: hypothetical protein VST70_10070 [Nitrospirota bacterium]|nr:hypothetical protein [Nitrospirota bacterium]